jgi:hypothetical protein
MAGSACFGFSGPLTGHSLDQVCRFKVFYDISVRIVGMLGSSRDPAHFGKESDWKEGNFCPDSGAVVDLVCLRIL